MPPLHPSREGAFWICQVRLHGDALSSSTAIFRIPRPPSTSTPDA
uniref:Uncharacterized protein n=1 Tax=Triticum urartu TaxID=4572 RepID=A0A8R7UHB7_TRIUA